MLHPGKKLVGGSASRARGVLFGLLTVFIPGVTLVVTLSRNPHLTQRLE